MRHAFLLIVCACGNAGQPQPDGGGTDSGTEAAPVVDAGPSSISGSADGTPFTTAAQALWLGAPDSASTTVVYVFSKPIACSDLASPGWDTRIPDATQFLEMKMFGTAPASFTVVTTLTPAPGEASVNYTLSSQTGTPNEMGASGGTVTLDTVQAQLTATGTVDVHFAQNTLTGNYVATYCPGGHEP